MTTLTKAGRYDLREELGRGTMGVVYHGFDPMIGRDVAVKTLRLSEAGTGLSREELIGRFQTEARAAGLLTHPNIVVVFDAGEEGGLFYITMEFVEGRSLQSLIDSKQPFPVSRVLKVMEQICSALDFAHQHNVVHRDIKPANLMLAPDDTVKITDFGTAKILQFGTAQTAHVMGTPSYMSPEQVKGKPVDGRSDIFSLGVVLYELMTGEKPFPGQNITTVIYKIINEEPIPPRSLDSSIHPGLSAVISKALAKNPAERYQSCHELLSALRTYHEIMSPDATVRMAPVTSQSAPGAGRYAPRIGAVQPATPPQGAEQSAQFILPVPVEEHEKKPASVLLTFILLGIIGYSGYRVYPPLVDLWRLAREPKEILTTPAIIDSAPATSNVDTSGEKPDAISSSAPQVPGAPPTAAPPPAAATSQVEKAAPREASSPSAAPAGNAKGSEASPSIGGSADKSNVQQKPTAPPPPSPARLLESKLRKEMNGQPLANKIKLQTNGNALTLSGALTLAEHGVLLQHLRAVPAGVRVIDDTEITEGSNPNSVPAAAGWIWIRSTPAGARILVDGAETGQRTPARLELQPGEHEVRLEHQGFGSAERKVTVELGQTIQFTQALAAE